MMTRYAMIGIIWGIGGKVVILLRYAFPPHVLFFVWFMELKSSERRKMTFLLVSFLFFPVFIRDVLFWYRDILESHCKIYYNLEFDVHHRFEKAIPYVQMSTEFVFTLLAWCSSSHDNDSTGNLHSLHQYEMIIISHCRPYLLFLSPCSFLSWLPVLVQMCYDWDIIVKMQKETWKKTLILAFQSLGIVYGRLSTAPLYVFMSIPGEDITTEQRVYELFSFVFWTMTIIPLLKYAFIVLRADDNGEGKFSIITYPKGAI